VKRTRKFFLVLSLALSIMAKHYVEEIPSFALKFSFQSNMAFLLAIFILALAMGWALRDHRKRQLELAVEEQEDRLYLTILGILFSVTSMGSYYAFNKTEVDTSGKMISHNPLVSEIVAGLRELFSMLDRTSSNNWPPYTPELPVKVSLPTTHELDHQIKEAMDKSPDSYYNSISLFGLHLLVLVSTWYFFPRKRPDISPPMPYMAFDVGKGDQTLANGSNSYAAHRASRGRGSKRRDSNNSKTSKQQ